MGCAFVKFDPIPCSGGNDISGIQEANENQALLDSKFKSLNKRFNNFLLTKLEGRTGRISPKVFLVWTKRRKFHTRKDEGDIFSH